MTLRSSDLQSDSDLDSIRNSCDVDLCLNLYLYLCMNVFEFFLVRCLNCDWHFFADMRVVLNNSYLLCVSILNCVLSVIWLCCLSCPSKSKSFDRNQPWERKIRFYQFLVKCAVRWPDDQILLDQVKRKPFTATPYSASGARSWSQSSQNLAHSPYLEFMEDGVYLIAGEIPSPPVNAVSLAEHRPPRHQIVGALSRSWTCCLRDE